MRNYSKSNAGFTLVEIIVVIVIIAVLAGITIVGYGAWRNSVLTSEVKSTLGTAASSMENSRNFEETYPSALPSTIEGGDNVILDLDAATDDYYCIDGVSAENASIQYYISSVIKDKGAQPGTCATSSSVAPVTPAAFAVAASALDQITLSWTNSGGATSYIIQCARDAAFIENVKTATVTSSPGAVTNLDPNVTYFCRGKAANSAGDSAWSAPVSTTTVVVFGTIAAATNLQETSIGGTSTTVTWNAIVCNLGTPSYRMVWVSGDTGSTAWGSSLTTVLSHTQATSYTWKVETKCSYAGIDSSVASSTNKSFTSIVTAPSGAFGTIGWNDRWDYNANSNTFTCVSPAVEEYTIVKTLNDATSGTWTYAWSTSTTQSVSSNTNQGAHITVYMQVRCRVGATSSTVLSSSSRTDNASVDAPGNVPSWCVGSCGSPKGNSWGAVGCPAGTYAVYYAHTYGDYGNNIFGPYEAANFYQFNRAVYYDGNQMLHEYLAARCTSAYRSSGWGPANTMYW